METFWIWLMEIFKRIVKTPEEEESRSPSSTQEEVTDTGTGETETQSSVDAQSEEEMVEDFNAELEDIFKLIESDDVQ